MKTREVEIFAEYENGNRFKPVGISFMRGFVLRPLEPEEGGEEETAIVKLGEVALIIIENGKESYLKFKP